MFWLIIAVFIAGVILICAIEVNEQNKRETEHRKMIARQKELEWQIMQEHKRKRKNTIQQLLTQLKEIARQYSELENAVLKELNFSDWEVSSYYDERVIVKSRQALEKYDDIKFFKENSEKFEQAENIIKRNLETEKALKAFLKKNEYNKFI